MPCGGVLGGYATLERGALAAEGRPRDLLVERQAGHDGCIATHAAMMTMPRHDPQRGIAMPGDCGDGKAPPIRRARAGLMGAASGADVRDRLA